MNADRPRPAGVPTQRSAGGPGLPADLPGTAAERRIAREQRMDRELRRMALLHRRSMRRRTPLVRAGAGRLTAGA